MVQRRKFIKGAISSTIALSGIGLTGFSNATLKHDSSSNFPSLKKDSIILFQGDSITDSGWSREEVNPNSQLGKGYVALAAPRLLRDYPEKNLSIYNRRSKRTQVISITGQLAGGLY